uniref:Chibby family member 3 n=1 Tax=Latimeria chalumnae TaxID=7897 RepID=H3AV49_LATCH
YTKLNYDFKPRRAPLRQPTSLSTLYIMDYQSRMHELGLDYGFPTLQLDDQRYAFQEGMWVSEPRSLSGFDKRVSRDSQETTRLLREENFFLKVKVELLLDMLTETTLKLLLLEDQLQEKDEVQTQRK